MSCMLASLRNTTIGVRHSLVMMIVPHTIVADGEVMCQKKESIVSSMVCCCE